MELTETAEIDILATGTDPAAHVPVDVSDHGSAFDT